MSSFTRSISNTFRGAMKAFRTFPVSVGCALAFAVVAAIRIEMDWPQQETVNFLFNCLHWALAFGAVFGLAAVTAAQSRLNTARAFTLSNLLTVLIAALVFTALYAWGGERQEGLRYDTVRVLAATRVAAAIAVSLVTFLLLSGREEERSDFPSSFFMAHKAFFIAAIYGGVIFAGASGVAGAVQTLLYRDMSEKVFMHIGTAVGFLTFSIFIGYFPDFRKGSADPHREVAQKQPRFIEVLFAYIMVPLVLALTVVLLLWAGKTVLSGERVPFVRLSAISAAYTIGGLWLHAMLSKHESGISKFYRRVYPLASVIILLFEAWAVVRQLQAAGLQATEYIFILLWILAAAGCALLLILRVRAHRVIALLACALAVVAVLPVLGYQALPVTAQVRRLESLLAREGILSEGTLTPAAVSPDKQTRAAITDAVDYLANAPDARLPLWFDENLGDSQVFRAAFGFDQIWDESGEGYGPEEGRYLWVNLTLPPSSVDISEFTWALNPQGEEKSEGGQTSVVGKRGTYRIIWTADGVGLPTLEITLDGQSVLREEMRDYAAGLREKYPPSLEGSTRPAPEDMTLRLETAEITALLVFEHVEMNFDSVGGTEYYWFMLKNLFLREND